MMRPFANDAVKAAFEAFPPDSYAMALTLRDLIFSVALDTPGGADRRNVEMGAAVLSAPRNEIRLNPADRGSEAGWRGSFRALCDGYHRYLCQHFSRYRSNRGEPRGNLHNRPRHRTNAAASSDLPCVDLSSLALPIRNHACDAPTITDQLRMRR